MGLDMYLEARVSAYKPYGDEPKETRNVLEAAADKIGLPASDNIDFITLSREVAYWRKANQIHKWFVDHCQGGNDDCRHAYVDREQLKELRDLCQRVLDKSSLIPRSVIGIFLPSSRRLRIPRSRRNCFLPSPGFFFGGTDYDQYYVSDLESTIAQIDKCLKLPDNAEFYYHSSW